MRQIAVSVALFILSWIAFAWLITPFFATVILVLLGIHESGHLIAMARNGMSVRGLYFIPLLGAVITTDKIRDRWVGVKVSLAGPLIGAVSAVLALGIHALWPAPEAAAAAFMAAGLNLFNMLPMFPIDGGQALAYATDRGGPLAGAAKRIWIFLFLSVMLISIVLQSFLLAVLAACFGWSAAMRHLRELGRREDRDRIRAALAAFLGVKPEEVVAAVEAPLRRLQDGEAPAFPEALLKEHLRLHAAEGCRRIAWCVPDDEDHAAISDEDARAWSEDLNAILERNACEAYDDAIQWKAYGACGRYRLGPFPQETVTRLADLEVGPILSPIAAEVAALLPELALSSQTRFAQFMDESVPPITPERSRHGLIAYAALTVFLIGLTVTAGLSADWSLKALY